MDIKELTTVLEHVKQRASANDAKGATEALRAAEMLVWSTLPLFIQKALLVVEKAAAFGVYDPRPSNVFHEGEPILVYLEPGAFDFKVENGVYGMQLSADFALLTPDGQVLAGQRDFMKAEFRARSPVTNFMLNVTMNLSGLTAGDYVLELVLHDMVQGNNQASVRLPFTYA